jgi:hypothetical protein
LGESSAAKGQEFSAAKQKKGLVEILSCWERDAAKFDEFLFIKRANILQK